MIIMQNGDQIKYAICMKTKGIIREFDAEDLICTFRSKLLRKEVDPKLYIGFRLDKLPKYVQNALYLAANGPERGLEEVDLSLQRVLDVLISDEDLQKYDEESERRCLEKLRQSDIEIDSCLQRAPFPIEN